MKFQSDTDPILHLMGEASELRRTIFQSAYENVCSIMPSLLSHEVQPPNFTYTFPKQLNQSRENLIAQAEQVYSRLSNQLYFSIDHDNTILKEKVNLIASLLRLSV